MKTILLAVGRTVQPYYIAAINEYVELAKYYGTPKSRAFVNGLLDRLVQNLANDGAIAKEGKGLL